MKDAKGHGSDPRGGPASHQVGVDKVGRPHWNLPPAPGTAPIPPGSVRLYHQTAEANLGAIKHNGLTVDKAKGIEGPRAVYADEKGFYGEPGGKIPTVEFYVPQERWDRPFVRTDSVKDAGMVAPQNILAVHYPWHEPRYIENNPAVLKATVAGEHDNLLKHSEYAKAIRFIKHKYG